MALTEMTSKVIERAEALTEKKLHVAIELTKIMHPPTQNASTEKEILKTFYIFYNDIKEIAPPPVERFTAKRKKICIIVGIIILLIALGIYLLNFFGGLTVKDIIYKILNHF